MTNIKANSELIAQTRKVREMSVEQFAQELASANKEMLNMEETNIYKSGKVAGKMTDFTQRQRLLTAAATDDQLKCYCESHFQDPLMQKEASEMFRRLCGLRAEFANELGITIDRGSEPHSEPTRESAGDFFGDTGDINYQDREIQKRLEGDSAYRA